MLLGSLLSAALMGFNAVYAIVMPRSGPHISPIVIALAGIPNFLISLRGFLGMLIMFWKRDNLVTLISAAENIAQTTFSQRAVLAKNCRTWLTFNIVLAGFCLVTFIIVFSLSWLHGFEYENRSMYGTYSLLMDTLTMPVWSYIVLQVTFIYIPYYFTQLMLIAAVSMGYILGDCSTALNDDLRQFAKTLNSTVSKLNKLPDNEHHDQAGSTLQNFDKLFAEIKRHAHLRERLFHFSDQWNEHFGFFVFLSYIADVGAAAGMLTVLVTGSETSSVEFPAKLSGALGFVLFATMTYLPLATAAEMAAHAKIILYEAIGTAYELHDKFNMQTLWNSVKDFSVMVSLYPIHFHACGFFFVERKFIVTTLTLLVSFTIILVEFLSKVGEEREVLSEDALRPAIRDMLAMHLGINFSFLQKAHSNLKFV
ncbi:uncharacterized protein LOC129597617 [Paramacrobiotus metropolitanus]|uniref:uncharacterized protein LOC129597617 n=1 Tax=Paramacrobiotus metropolitanus TaxID=2943436 RepID=UPI0024457E4B|nr:uncharacterized protein LOC129597617 [Paramacrobiotus metropolitanus]